MNYPTIPRMFPAMIAPKVSRRFYDVLSMIGLWSSSICVLLFRMACMPGVWIQRSGG